MGNKYLIAFCRLLKSSFTSVPPPIVLRHPTGSQLISAELKHIACCDISINAAGSTTYELAACGVPALLVVVEDNQVELARESDKRSFAINLGWHSELRKEYLFDTMDRTIEDHALRQAMTAWGQELIDGKGAKRLADNLLNAI